VAHYAHTRDIDPEEAIDAQKVDDQLGRAVHPLAIAFECQEDLGASFRALMADMIRQFLGTHESIRLVMKNRVDNPRGMADAMSLAREQIEKVYTVVLLLEDPEAWTERYVKDAWRKSYERHLLDKDERSGLPRYKQFLNDQANSLEEERKLLGITAEEKKVVEIRYKDVPGSKRTKIADPAFKAAEQTIANFPMPMEVIRTVIDPQLKLALARFYREYGYFSGYSHSGFAKLMRGFMEGNMKLTTSQKEKVVETEYAQSIMASYLATGIACAEAATRRLPRGPGGSSGASPVAEAELLVKLSDLWTLLERSSLVGRALYEMRARHVLPPTFATS
jgi:hypothetical protein